MPPTDMQIRTALMIKEIAVVDTNQCRPRTLHWSIRAKAIAVGQESAS